jgi:hypothetical protein
MGNFILHGIVTLIFIDQYLLKRIISDLIQRETVCQQDKTGLFIIKAPGKGSQKSAPPLGLFETIRF